MQHVLFFHTTINLLNARVTAAGIGTSTANQEAPADCTVGTGRQADSGWKLGETDEIPTTNFMIGCTSEINRSQQQYTLPLKTNQPPNKI